jgi:hypothetical protein
VTQEPLGEAHAGGFRLEPVEHAARDAEAAGRSPADV